MLLEIILNAIKALFINVLNFIPILETIQVPGVVVTFMTNIMVQVAYFLPITDMLIIFGLWILTKNFHIIWRGIQRIWDGLPFT